MNKTEAASIVLRELSKLGRFEPQFKEAIDILIMPELESEDERIRKFVVEVVKAHTCNPMREDAIAWLEKQGEKNEQTKHPDMVANVKEYFANTPKEQIEKDWEELKHWNNVGPTVEEFLYGERRNPANWGERDIMILDSAIEILNSFGSTYETTLKGLRLIKSSLQPQWEPSDEQMTALEHVSSEYAGSWMPELLTLFDDLKNLRGK